MIQGAVYTDRLIVQNLCDGIYVGRDNVFDTDLLWRLTHVFECVTHLIANLDILYARLATRLSQVSPSDLPALLKLEPEDNHQHFFPASQSFKDKNGKVIHLTYEDAIRKDAWGTTYRARTSTGQMVVVKFVQKYGIDAHRFLAEMGYAPKVHYYGNIYEDAIERPLRPRMVVMEFIDGESAFTASLSPSQCQSLRQAIDALHYCILPLHKLCDLQFRHDESLQRPYSRGPTRPEPHRAAAHDRSTAARIAPRRRVLSSKTIDP